ncbi:MAG: hypothetical protein COU28_01005 [Candidatus Magasanikbacteria bacterium CG10_big_fil_rev_8_21_14_0_10_36_16]|uniref:Uncharacterized protein n=1 Tax=Candidatus Magasanikbacteria bacterium CG10_big_fil_rev_8_21_14_0_10_36_16 TaxID=1974645 RepID=A0A2H0TZA9_9BACT|nr:MAG: hypothetical protein COU28_01005 [Candidatus Magasanikbacteria bacterium CG10_big_fil_rev_8_21_14_0_10_36_16]
MSKRRFNKEQIEQLVNNQNVSKCSEKAITYNKEFKIRAVREYQKGLSSRQIFKEAGLDIDLVGKYSAKNCVMDWVKLYKVKGIDSLSVETRDRYGGRPKTKWSTDADKIKYLEAKVAYLKAENDFLAKLRAKKAE